MHAKIKNNQQGRSMVELLAVMAIAGVLSVTGIYSYNLAMVKHRANEIIHRANLGYVDIMAHDDTNSWIDLKIKQVDNTLLKGRKDNDAGYVEIKNVEKDVCNHIVNNLTDFTVLSDENTRLTVCTESQTNMIFDFANTGSMQFDCKTKDDCFDGQECSLLTNSCITPSDCADSTPYWNPNTEQCEDCSTSRPDEPYYANNDCHNCAATFHDPFKPYYDGNSCEECPAATPKWDDMAESPNCTTCENYSSLYGTNTPYWESTKKECVACTADSHCGENVCNPTTNTCVECNDDTNCPTNSYCKANSCIICPENSVTATTSNGQLPNTSCYCTENYIANENTCTPNCPVNSAINGTGNTTSNPLCKCNAGVLWWNAGVCKGCPAGYTWNGNACAALTAQQKCAAVAGKAPLYWSYHNGECSTRPLPTTLADWRSMCRDIGLTFYRVHDIIYSNRNCSILVCR